MRRGRKRTRRLIMHRATVNSEHSVTNEISLALFKIAISPSSSSNNSIRKPLVWPPLPPATATHLWPIGRRSWQMRNPSSEPSTSAERRPGTSSVGNNRANAKSAIGLERIIGARALPARPCAVCRASRMSPLYARVAKHNIASIRVLRKCGFTISGEDGFLKTDGEGDEEFILVLDYEKVPV